MGFGTVVEVSSPPSFSAPGGMLELANVFCRASPVTFPLFWLSRADPASSMKEPPSSGTNSTCEGPHSTPLLYQIVLRPAALMARTLA
jgi:hypothetical protein